MILFVVLATFHCCWDVHFQFGCHLGSMIDPLLLLLEFWALELGIQWWVCLILTSLPLYVFICSFNDDCNSKIWYLDIFEDKNVTDMVRSKWSVFCVDVDEEWSFLFLFLFFCGGVYNLLLKDKCLLIRSFLISSYMWWICEENMHIFNWFLLCNICISFSLVAHWWLYFVKY